MTFNLSGNVDASSLPRKLLFGRASWLRSFAEAVAIGVLIGLVDIHRGDGSPWETIRLSMLAGIYLGFRYAGRASACWPPLGVSLYVVHLIAIACGCKPPHVESSDSQAARTLDVYGFAGLGLFMGVLVRVALNAMGYFRRSAGPPVCLFPRSVPQWLFLVFCFALGLGGVRLADGSKTVYAAGYDDFRFHQIKVGMTMSQVEAALGRPLNPDSGSVQGVEVWFYSLGETSLDDYWMRWIFFEDGRVSRIVSDYSED